MLRATNGVHSVKLRLKDGRMDLYIRPSLRWSLTHTGWQQQSLMYINEHIYAYKGTYFIIRGT